VVVLAAAGVSGVVNCVSLGVISEEMSREMVVKTLVVVLSRVVAMSTI
jgi:hypothetical protein